ncbi:MAG: hypothetical protein H6Q75_1632 [Firmicutes bacterium]|nr:hypothetical protein [Bacillota bacterium]
MIKKDTTLDTGYGPNNPEPLEFKESAADDEADAFLGSDEYINGKSSTGKDQGKSHMPCKNSVPT